jgi:hypothetical protein
MEQIKQTLIHTIEKIQERVWQWKQW